MNPLIAQGISSAVTTAANYLLQDRVNDKNVRIARQNAALSDFYQRQLTHDTPALSKSGYQDAGLSVAALSAPFSASSSNAGVASTPSTAPQVAPIDAISAESVVQDIKNKKVENDNLKKQGDLIDEEARSKKIDNDVKEREFNNETALGALRASDYFRKYRAEHPEEDDYTALAKAPTYMSDGVYQFNMGYTPTKLKREYIENISSISSDTLKKAVADKQLSNNEVIDALVKLPVQQFNQVKQAVQKLLNDNDLFQATRQYLIDEKKYGVDIAIQNLNNLKLLYKSNDLAYKLDQVLYPLQVAEATSKNNYDWKQLLDKILNGDGGWKDTLRLVTVMLASFLGANNGKFLPNRSHVTVSK